VVRHGVQQGLALSRAVLVAALLVAALPATAQARVPRERSTPSLQPVTTSADWLAFGRDSQLTNYAPQAWLTRANASKVQELWSADLDGQIIASPLFDNDVVYAATEAGSVFALRSNDGTVLWSDRFGGVGTQCGPWGISSTGAVDAARDLLYVANADGLLRALDLATGAVVWTLPITDRTQTEYVWGGLRLAGDLLYVPVASYCDAPDEMGQPAEGRVVAVNVSSRAPAATFDTVPGPDNLGGVWGWGGVSVEPDGSAVWTAVGNSDVVDRGCGCTVDDAGDGDHVVELTPLLQPLAADKPADVPSANDYDFGAAPLLFDVPDCGSYAAANNKDGSLYVWSRDALDDGPIAEFRIGTATAPFLGEPAWSAPARTLFDASTNVVAGADSLGDGVAAIAFTTSCRPVLRWQTVTGTGTQPPPIVLGEAVFAAGGSGGWDLLSATTGDVLWHRSTSAQTLAPPIAAAGRIFAGDGGTLHAFGMVR
jgi:outer membrane protein assembly factor BamB